MNRFRRKRWCCLVHRFPSIFVAIFSIHHRFCTPLYSIERWIDPDKELFIRHCRRISIFIFEGWIKLGTTPPITPQAMGVTLTIAAILIIGPLSKSTPRLVKIMIRLFFLASRQLSYSETSEHTFIIEFNSFVSRLCLKDLDQDSISHKNFPGSVFGLRVLGFIVCLFGVVVFLLHTLEVPGYRGSIQNAVNLDTSLEALKQRGSHTITGQTLDVETKHDGL